MDKKSYKVFCNFCLDRIKQALNEHYLSIFAGAGISVPSNLPTWKDLMKEISDMLYSDKDQTEDFLILAEKFYNTYGKNAYYQKLKEFTLFDTAVPNKLHRSIINLDIKNLITTNWDNLFEKAIEDEGRFYNFILKDEDIGYSTGFAKFIKMHGNLEDQNVVFREKDYLEYSSNFPLIENYLKGVFSTDCVLLIGYSLSDNNVKQIINWVNSKATNIKPVYFIKTEKNYDYYEFEFYKNKNIYILYLRDFINSDKEDQSEILQKFLDLLIARRTFNINHLNLKNKEDIDKLEEEISLFLKSYKKYEFISPYLLIQDMYQYFCINESDIYYADFGFHIKNPFLQQFNPDIYNYISRLTLSIVAFDNKERAFWSVEDVGKLDDLVFMIFLDSNAIEKKIKQISRIDKNKNQSLLKKAFLLYKNEHFIDAYKELEYISKKAFKEKDYISWYISETNKQKFICKFYSAVDLQEFIDYINTHKDDGIINLENKYLQLPLNVREKLRGVRSLDSFVLQLEKYSYELKDKSLKMFFDNEKQEFNFDYYNAIATYMLHYGLKIEINLFIIEDLKLVYKNITEALLMQYSLQYKELNGDCDNFSIDAVVVSAIIYYLSLEDLIEIFTGLLKKRNIILKCKGEDILVKVFDNICREIKNSYRVETRHRLFFKKFLWFAAWISFEQKSLNLILDNIIKKQELLSVSEYSSISYFVYGQREYCIENVHKLKQIISKFLDSFLENKFDSNEFYTLLKDSTNLLITIVDLLKKQIITLDANLNKKILNYIDEIKAKSLIDKGNISFLFLSVVYYICNKNTKTQIVQFTINVYKEIKDFLKSNLFEYNSKEYINVGKSIDVYMLVFLGLGMFLYKCNQIFLEFDKQEYIDYFYQIKEIVQSNIRMYSFNKETSKFIEENEHWFNE